MFRRKSDEALWRLQQELLAAEEEEYGEEEEFEEGYEDEYEDEYGETEDLEAYFDSGCAEEYEEEAYAASPASGYRRGSQKRFEDRDFFEDDVSDEEVVYQKDYKKAKRKKRRQNGALALLAVLEILCIGAIIAWWIAWTR